MYQVHNVKGAEYLFTYTDWETKDRNVHIYKQYKNYPHH